MCFTLRQSAVALLLSCCFSLQAVQADLQHNAQSGPQSFREAKQMAARLYASLPGGPRTFYCNCAFSGKQIDASACGYKARKNPRRGARLEWEHVVPAWEFGHQLQCWQNGGRKNCSKNDAQFRRMEADLHNLVPTVGELNGDRSNYRFGMLEGEARRYGRCDFEVDFKQRRAEPEEDRRGDIARIYFYMRDQYGLKISRQQTQLFNAWHKLDAADDAEREREQRINALQGNGNCYIRRCADH